MKSAGTRCRSARSAGVWAGAASAAVRMSPKAAADRRAPNQVRMRLSLYMLSPPVPVSIPAGGGTLAWKRATNPPARTTTALDRDHERFVAAWLAHVNNGIDVIARGRVRASRQAVSLRTGDRTRCTGDFRGLTESPGG